MSTLLESILNVLTPNDEPLLELFYFDNETTLEEKVKKQNSLSGVPSGIAKHITTPFNSIRPGAGSHSDILSEPKYQKHKNISHLNNSIRNISGYSGSISTIHVDGKPVVGIKSVLSHHKHSTVQLSDKNGRIDSRRSSNTHTVSNALKHIHSTLEKHLGKSLKDKQTYKDHDISIKQYSNDFDKELKQGYRKETFKDSLDSNREKALNKMVSKKISDKSSQKSKLLSLNKELQNHIENDNEDGIKTVTSKIKDHMYYEDNPLSEISKDSNEYKKALLQLKKPNNNWAKEHAKYTIKHMKEKGIVKEELKMFTEEELEYIEAILEDDFIFETYIITNLENIELNEDVGNLKGLSKHLMHVITKNKGGDQSDVIDHGRVNSHSKFKSTLSNAMKDHNSVHVVYHNDKPIGALHTTYAATGIRSEYGVDSANKTETRSTSEKVPGSGPYKEHTYQTTTHNKDQALTHMLYTIASHHANNADMTDKQTYKDHNFSIKSFKQDKNRKQKQIDRKEARPDLGNDTLKKIKSSAIDKMADKHVSSSGPYDKTKELHAAIGKAIEDKNYDALRNRLHDLDHHINYDNAFEDDSYDKRKYKNAINNISTKSDWYKDLGRKALKKLKDKGSIKEELNYYISEAKRGRPPKVGSEAWKKAQANTDEASEPRQHIIQQLQRAKLSMSGGAKVKFDDGGIHHIQGNHAAKIIDKYMGMKPLEKQSFQKELGKSHENFKKYL